MLLIIGRTASGKDTLKHVLETRFNLKFVKSCADASQADAGRGHSRVPNTGAAHAFPFTDSPAKWQTGARQETGWSKGKHLTL